jgi:hypothetical protein
MNHLLRTAALLACPFALHAQSLNITAPGYSGVKLFEATAGHTITGLGAAPGGDIFYIESDSAFTSNARLYRRSPGDGYATSTTLFDFGAPIFGSFVVFNGGKIFFGESSTGQIRSINPDGTGIDLLGTVAGNYDLAFAGSSLYLSHNPGGFSPLNKVTKFTLVGSPGDYSLDAGTLIIDTPMDYSGPVELASGGALFYGGSGPFGQPHLYRYAAAEIDGTGPVLSLDGPHLHLANGTNAYLAFDGSDALWHTNFGTLNLIGVTTPTSTAIGSTTDSIGQLDFTGGTLYVNVTKASFDGSAVYAVVPEPSCALLALAGLILSSRRRRG